MIAWYGSCEKALRLHTTGQVVHSHMAAVWIPFLGPELTGRNEEGLYMQINNYYGGGGGGGYGGDGQGGNMGGGGNGQVDGMGGGYDDPAQGTDYGGGGGGGGDW